jgi:hypothetical protein
MNKRRGMRGFVVHESQFTGVVPGQFSGIMIWVVMANSPVEGVAVLAEVHLQTHAVAHWNNAVEDQSIADHPRRDGNRQSKRGNQSWHTPESQLLQIATAFFIGTNGAILIPAHLD